jgi:hypothetical protein
LHQKAVYWRNMYQQWRKKMKFRSRLKNYHQWQYNIILYSAAIERQNWNLSQITLIYGKSLLYSCVQILIKIRFFFTFCQILMSIRTRPQLTKSNFWFWPRFSVSPISQLRIINYHSFGNFWQNLNLKQVRNPWLSIAIWKENWKIMRCIRYWKGFWHRMASRSSNQIQNA